MMISLVFLLLASQISGLSLPSTSFPASRLVLNGVEHHIRDTGDPAGDDSGSAPVAVLLHGFAGNTDSWEDVAPLLRQGGVRAIAVDRVGFGRTERPPAPTLPPPPPLPGRELLAASIEALVTRGSEPAAPGLRALIPDPRAAFATALRRPATLAPRLPWQLSALGRDPYSSSFAVAALAPLVAARVQAPAAGDTGRRRRVYFVGHSAGGPLALRALCAALQETTADGSPFLPPRCDPAGVCLVAPAVLDPQEDPDAYQADPESNKGDQKGGGNSGGGGRASDPELPLAVRMGFFRALLSLPDAFSLGLARRLADGRDVKAALLDQTHASMGRPERAARLERLAEKYSAPVREAPEDWDTALMSVYRADFLAQEGGGAATTRGRGLLSAAAGAARKSGGVEFCVVTGDDDRVVPVRASRRVAGLLGSDVRLMKDTGHLPMDERPEELAKILLDFIGR